MIAWVWKEVLSFCLYVVSIRCLHWPLPLSRLTLADLYHYTLLYLTFLRLLAAALGRQCSTYDTDERFRMGPLILSASCSHMIWLCHRMSRVCALAHKPAEGLLTLPQARYDLQDDYLKAEKEKQSFWCLFTSRG